MHGERQGVTGTNSKKGKDGKNINLLGTRTEKNPLGGGGEKSATAKKQRIRVHRVEKGLKDEGLRLDTRCGKERKKTAEKSPGKGKEFQLGEAGGNNRGPKEKFQAQQIKFKASAQKENCGS